MAVDTQSALYVPDVQNNRVLKYESPFANDSTADEVWGQADFTGIACNRGDESPSADTLCFVTAVTRWGPHNGSATGVAIGSQGSLWVTDAGNHRVLRFPVEPATGLISKTADLVLGQKSFEDFGYGSGLDQMYAPSSIEVGPGGLLYVADFFNHRILVFEPPFESGMAAVRTFGSNIRAPNGLESDPEGRGLWVHDHGNGMVELWDWAGTRVEKVFLRDKYLPDHRPSYTSGGIAIDGRGNLLVPDLGYGQDIMIFNTSHPGGAERGVVDPDRRLFSPPGGFNLTDTDELITASGVAIWGDQLVVADVNRLMYWNNLARLESGSSPDGVVGFETHYIP